MHAEHAEHGGHAQHVVSFPRNKMLRHCLTYGPQFWQTRGHGRPPDPQNTTEFLADAKLHHANACSTMPCGCMQHYAMRTTMRMHAAQYCHADACNHVCECAHRRCWHKGICKPLALRPRYALRPAQQGSLIWTVTISAQPQSFIMCRQAGRQAWLLFIFAETSDTKKRHG